MSQSQSNFTTGGLPPISVSWRQAPWDSRSVFIQLNTCGHSPYVTFSMTRKWVCRLQLLLVLASAVIFRSESRGTRDHILLVSNFRLPQPEGPGPRIYIPQEQGGPTVLLTSQHGLHRKHRSYIAQSNCCLADGAENIGPILLNPIVA
jgi:hypothetical protein